MRLGVRKPKVWFGLHLSFLCDPKQVPEPPWASRIGEDRTAGSDVLGPRRAGLSG